MRTRRILQLEVMKFYQREENREKERKKTDKQVTKKNIIARLVGLK
jgi:hypothetical protein